MVQGKTHYSLTKSMYPHMSGETIYQVNKALDNPSMVTRGLSKIARESQYARFMPQFPGLSRRGHRVYGHDLTTAMWTGYLIGGPDGMLAAFGHLAEDSMSDMMAKALTPEGRDVMEAMYNYNNKRVRRRYRKAYTRPNIFGL